VAVHLAGAPATPADGRMLARLDLPNVRYQGAVSRERMPAWYHELDCFVLPSLSENFPLTVLEAMGCGVPVIASRVGGIPEAITAGENGLLVTPGDTADLVQAIRHLAQDRTRAAMLGHAGRETVLRRFSLDLQVQRQLQLYAKIEEAAA